MTRAVLAEVPLSSQAPLETALHTNRTSVGRPHVAVDGYRVCSIFQFRQPNTLWGETSIGCATLPPISTEADGIPEVPPMYKSLMDDATAIGRSRGWISKSGSLVPEPGARWRPAGRDIETHRPRRAIDVKIYDRTTALRDLPSARTIVEDTEAERVAPPTTFNAVR